MKNRGFSLLEMMIAISILGILISGAMSMVSFFTNFLQQQNLQNDKIEIQKTIEAVMSANCSCNFPSTVSYPGNKQDLTFTALNWYISPGCTAAMTPPAIQIRSRILGLRSNLQIESLKIVKILPKSNSTKDFYGDLEVGFTANGKSVPSYITQSKPFHFTIDPDAGNTIQSCSYGDGGAGGGSSGGSYTRGAFYGSCEEQSGVISNLTYPAKAGRYRSYNTCACENGFTPATLSAVDVYFVGQGERMLRYFKTCVKD